MGFEIIDVRRFEPQAFMPLLDAESRAWSEELRWDFSASAQVISNCLQERRLAGYALVLDGQIRGYCFFFYDGEKGLIGDLFVNFSPREIDPALRLLEHVIETLLATPGLRRVETQLPHFRYDDLEPFFRDHSFEGYRREFMALSLVPRSRTSATSVKSSSAGNQESPQDMDDFLILPWERKYDREAAELLYMTYRGHVDAALNDQYNSLAGATRLIENIVHQKGCGEFLPHVSRLAIHRASRRLAGILAVTAVRTRTAHIPQVAVGQPFQGYGLGSLIMESAFADLDRQGYQELSLTVTEANTGAVRLYERLGFKPFRKFGAFVFRRS